MSELEIDARSAVLFVQQHTVFIKEATARITELVNTAGYSGSYKCGKPCSSLSAAGVNWMPNLKHTDTIDTLTGCLVLQVNCKLDHETGAPVVTALLRTRPGLNDADFEIEASVLFSSSKVWADFVRKEKSRISREHQALLDKAKAKELRDLQISVEADQMLNDFTDAIRKLDKNPKGLARLKDIIDKELSGN